MGAWSEGGGRWRWALLALAGAAAAVFLWSRDRAGSAEVPDGETAALEDRIRAGQACRAHCEAADRTCRTEHRSPEVCEADHRRCLGRCPPVVGR